MRIKNTWVRVSVLLLILLFAILRSWYGTRLDSLANDEPYHIISGAYYVQTGDYRLNPEHPPLNKLWVGLWNKDNLKLRPFEPLSDKYEERKWLQEIMYYDNDDRLSQERSRWAMYSFHFILGLVILLLLWRIFGFKWALISAIWIALEPTIGAHQPLVFTDLPLSYCLLISALTAGLFCRSWNWKWLIAFGVSVGLTVGVKHSALPGMAGIILLSVVICLLPLRRKLIRVALIRTIKFAMAGVIALCTIWSIYGFQKHSSEGGQDHFNRTLAEKIEDLNSPSWKKLITFMEGTNILPRAYIWGLADTVRAGVEGRGDDEHRFFGKVVTGKPPILYFSSRVITKVPLALLGMVLIALFLLIRDGYRRMKAKDKGISGQRWLAIAFIAVFVIAHMLALASGRTSYGGIRHALPAVVGLGAIAGAVVLLQNTRKKRLSWIIPTALFLVTIGMTIGEKRIYEYHNLLLGGTENSYKYFYDEGMFQGQRFYETETYFNRPEVDSSQPIYMWAWYMQEEWKATNLNVVEGVKDIHEEGEVGVLSGYFIVDIGHTLDWPNWDPTKFNSLEIKSRIGNILIMYGSMKDMDSWASSMIWSVRKYIRQTKEPDWELVVRRLIQCTEIVTYHTTPYVVLGNALTKLGKKEEAIAAYQKGMANLEENYPYELSMIEHIQLVKNTEDVTQLDRLRPMDVE
ncbi:MAG: phospholipid carrier-dependent glycosyltransferase [Bacteroidota bacterium]